MKRETREKIITSCMDTVQIFMDDALRARARAETSTDEEFFDRYCQLDDGFEEWAEEVFGDSDDTSDEAYPMIKMSDEEKKKALGYMTKTNQYLMALFTEAFGKEEK